MKRIRVNGEIGLLAALAILSIGIALVIKADFGMTVVQLPVYVLSLAVPSISMGIWNYIVQGALFLLMLIIVRKFKISYIISFVSAIIYGAILDLFNYLFIGLPSGEMYLRIIYFVGGFAIICVAVTLFFTCKSALMPYDIFIREVAETVKWKISKFKWFFDISCLVIAIILSLILTGKIIGIGVGTAIFAFLVGPIIGQMIKFVEKRVEFVSFIK